MWVKSIIDSIEFKPFTIHMNYIGRFKRDNKDLWWVGVHENAQLTKLHYYLVDKLISAGFKIEKRKFNPHITIGRKIVTEKEPCSIASFSETVTSIELMKSEHFNGALKYSVIHSLSV